MMINFLTNLYKFICRKGRETKTQGEPTRGKEARETALVKSQRRDAERHGSKLEMRAGDEGRERPDNIPGRRDAEHKEKRGSSEETRGVDSRGGWGAPSGSRAKRPSRGGEVRRETYTEASGWEEEETAAQNSAKRSNGASHPHRRGSGCRGEAGQGNRTTRSALNARRLKWRQK